MQKGFIIVAAIVLLGAGGAVEYVRSGKTADRETILAARAKLAAIPLTAGDWTGTDESFDEKMLEVAEASAFSHRDYVNEKTKHRVKVLIIAGSPKAIGAHDPTVCYGGAGFKQYREEAKLTVPAADGKSDSVWQARFDTETLPALSLSVMWAWTADGRWAASDRPRIDYAREPMLFKIYVSRSIGPRESEASDPSLELLKVLTPEIRKSFP
jgi:hypothetical protein